MTLGHWLHRMTRRAMLLWGLWSCERRLLGASGHAQPHGLPMEAIGGINEAVGSAGRRQLDSA